MLSKRSLPCDWEWCVRACTRVLENRKQDKKIEHKLFALSDPVISCLEIQQIDIHEQIWGNICTGIFKASVIIVKLGEVIIHLSINKGMAVYLKHRPRTEY